MSGLFGLFLTDPIEIPAGVARTAGRLLSPNGDERTSLWGTRSRLLGVCHRTPTGTLTPQFLQTNESGRIHAACEGSILNEPSLHHRLEREGHVFASGGTSGILAHLGEGHRLDWELGLRGSFSLAVWDDHERALRLAVDRAGAGCLYWAGDKDWIAFASTLPALRGMLLEWGNEESHPDVPRSLRGWLETSGWWVDPQAVGSYLASGSIGAPRSLCKSVYSLPPAGRLIWKAGTEPSVEVWWTPRFQPKRVLSLRRAIPEFRQVISETLPLYLDRANRNGLWLSADPASFFLCHETAALAGLDRVLHAFPGEESHPREREALRAMAAGLPIEYQEHPLPFPHGDGVIMAIGAMSEPYGHPSAWNTFAALREAGKRQGVWLSGAGSDEVWSVPPPRGSWWRRNPPPLVREMGRYQIDPQGRVWEGLLAPEMEIDPVPFPCPPDGEDMDPGRIDDLRMGIILPSIHLRPLHTMAAAHSLDIRLPWLDPILLEWMSRLPLGLKNNGGISHWLLRKALQAEPSPIPGAVLSMRSLSSSPPVHHWLSRNLAQLFSDTVLSTGAMTGPLFQASRLRQAFEANRAGVMDLGRPLWAVLILELWLRENRLAV